jgi:serine/threonine protein kinase
MIGTELEGRYRIQAELGAGGAGTVYRGLHVALGRAVAIKVLHPALSHSLELRQRFEREARALAALKHPNIVPIVDSGVTANAAYLVMDLLEGETLAHRLKSGPLSIPTAVSILRQLLLALGYVHEQGLVHRDVKPANVFLELAGTGKASQVRLLDFGLAKFVAPEVGDRALTRAGQVFGTPSYMAPEQIAGQPADARADVYAAGIVFFEMLSGSPPFRGQESEILRQHVMEELPIEALPSEAASPEIVRFLRKAAAKTRAERFATATEMLAELDVATAGLTRGVDPNDATVEAPSSSSAGALGDDSRDRAHDAKSPRSFGSLVFRLAATIGVVVSLVALAAAATATFVFVTPGHEEERRSLEAVLRLPPPKSPKPGTSTFVPHTLGVRAPVASAFIPHAPASVASPSGPVPPPSPADEPGKPPAEPPPVAPREPAPNPWASVPQELLRLLTKVNHGGGLEKRELMSVHKYNGKHGADPRGHLLLARGYMNRHWLKDAVTEYAVALEMNRDARGDPRMLPDLVRLAALGLSDAPRLIKETFGEAALPVIDRAFASPPKPEEKSRANLERLKSELPRATP